MATIYDKYDDLIVKDLTRILISKGKKGNSKLIRSLKPELKEVANVVTLSFSGEDYAQYVDSGRKPGSYAPIRELEKWASSRGIPKKAVFAINRSIFRFGIKPTNFIDSAVKNIYSKYIPMMEDDLAKKIEKELAEKFS